MYRYERFTCTIRMGMEYTNAYVPSVKNILIDLVMGFDETYSFFCTVYTTYLYKTETCCSRCCRRCWRRRSISRPLPFVVGLAGALPWRVSARDLVVGTQVWVHTRGNRSCPAEEARARLGTSEIVRVKRCFFCCGGNRRIRQM